MKGQFKLAFLKAIEEYNQFGQAAFSSRFRVDEQTALQMYGFKARKNRRMAIILSCHDECHVAVLHFETEISG